VTLAKPHKMKTTRPEFLLDLMTGGTNTIESITTDDIKKHLCDYSPLSYCVYSALMIADIDRDDIISSSSDGESIAITFRSKKIAKHIMELSDDCVVRYGTAAYQVHLKLRDNHIIAEVTPAKKETEQ